MVSARAAGEVMEKVGIPNTGSNWDDFEHWLAENPDEAVRLRKVGGKPYAWMRIETENNDLAVHVTLKFDGRWYRTPTET